MKIARYVVDDQPSFGVVMTEDGEPAWLAQIAGDPLYTQVSATGVRHELGDVRLLAPVIPRSKIVGVLDNYGADNHAAPNGGTEAGEPRLFLIPNTAVCGPDDPVVLPEFARDVHYGGSLAVVIGRMCKDVPAATAGTVVFGYTCANDVTAWDLRSPGGDDARAKGCDTFCPLGPWIETELDVSDAEIWTRLDGRTVQEGSTARHRHTVPELVSSVSRAFTLLPGDVILTGTPPGDGPMVAGQRVEVGIEGIGSMVNPVLRR